MTRYGALPVVPQPYGAASADPLRVATRTRAGGGDGADRRGALRVTPQPYGGRVPVTGAWA
ncbi:hypothetical protein [Streptomyces sp. NRRL F-5123]|uniref:hypothetical protein n=1 Tax=Streptomyces sp. NRRL F-5123 TaxID=1463856 RepID=UPI0004E20E12|nr:hypothetical protein [Streptomyces sp. NRRL F-5123]